jgi:hypothetical protein
MGRPPPRPNLFIALSNGPFLIERCLSALPRTRAFVASIVTDFTIRDSIFFANRAETTEKNGATPVFNTQWYERNDQHARQKPLRTGSARVEGSVIVGGKSQRALFREMIPIGRPGPYESYTYHADSNTYFMPAGDTQAFMHTDADWKRTWTTFEDWMQLKKESGSEWEDPGFTDPYALDFRVNATSPLHGRDDRLPLIRVDPDRLREAEKFFAWVGVTADQVLEVLDR